MPKHLTNVQLVKRLMERSRHGALMQAFVIEALARYAEQCAAADPKVFDSALLHGAAWHGCAIEMRDALRAHLDIESDYSAAERETAPGC